MIESVPAVKSAASRWSRLGLTALVALHGSLSLLYLQVLPLFNWPDEPAHFNYVRDLSEGRGLGTMEADVWTPQALERLKRQHFREVDPLEPEIGTIRYEAHQPPLYYALAAAVYSVLPSPRAVKLLNLALSCAVVIVVYLAGRRLFPARPMIAWGAALFTALVPMRCFMAVSIGNTIAAELCFALFVWALAAGARPLHVGAIAACGLWTHTGLVLTLPLYALWLLLVPHDRRGASPRRYLDVLRPAAVAAAVALVLWSPWIARNMSLYGLTDPLALSSGALGSGEAVVAELGQSRPRLALTGPSGVTAFVTLLFQSFWGVFGWMEMFFSRQIQGVFLLLSLPPIAGLFGLAAANFRRPLPSSERCARLIWLAVAAAAFVAVLAAYSLFDFQPQGRYLLIASVAFGLLYAAGLEWLLGRRTPMWLAVSSLTLVGINLYAALWMVPWYLAR